MSKLELVKKAFIKSTPVMAGYLVLGIGFGVLLSRAGYGPIWAFFMSLTIYAGTLQYVGVGLIDTGASVINTIFTSLFINIRHAFYGISMLENYKDAKEKKYLLAFAMTDETYALLCDGEFPEGANKYNYWLLVSMFNHIYWIIGGVLGVILNESISYDFEGVEFSMTAIFAASCADQWRTRKNHYPAIIGLVSTAISLIIFKSTYFLIPSMCIITIVLMLFKDKMEAMGI